MADKKITFNIKTTESLEFEVNNLKYVIGKNHAELDNLEYDKSGHIGFQEQLTEQQLDNIADVENKYEKPDTGIPKLDLSESVQNSLNLADTALQNLPDGIVVDKEYVHTDNNFTTQEKDKLASLENYDDTFIRFDIAENKQQIIELGAEVDNKANIDDVYTITEVNSIVTSIESSIQSVAEGVDDIESKIPNQATSSNQLADKDFVNSSVEKAEANYVTYNAAGDAFPTYESLLNAVTYYNQGQTYTPDKNDYSIVLDDSTHDNSTYKYYYDGTQWDPLYQVNDTPLTSDQLKAINSGITSELVGQIKVNQTEVAKKLNAVTSASILYGTNSTGVVFNPRWSQSAVGNTVAVRESTGALSVGTPVGDDDATPKEYVDDKVSNTTGSSTNVAYSQAYVNDKMYDWFITAPNQLDPSFNYSTPIKTLLSYALSNSRTQFSRRVKLLIYYSGNESCPDLPYFNEDTGKIGVWGTLDVDLSSWDVTVIRYYPKSYSQNKLAPSIGVIDVTNLGGSPIQYDVTNLGWKTMPTIAATFPLTAESASDYESPSTRQVLENMALKSEAFTQVITDINQLSPVPTNVYELVNIMLSGSVASINVESSSFGTPVNYCMLTIHKTATRTQIISNQSLSTGAPYWIGVFDNVDKEVIWKILPTVGSVPSTGGGSTTETLNTSTLLATFPKKTDLFVDTPDPANPSTTKGLTEKQIRDGYSGGITLYRHNITSLGTTFPITGTRLTFTLSVITSDPTPITTYDSLQELFIQHGGSLPVSDSYNSSDVIIHSAGVIPRDPGGTYKVLGMLMSYKDENGNWLMLSNPGIARDDISDVVTQL